MNNTSKNGHTALRFPLKIGEAAQASGIHAKMIRYYESIGLMPEGERSESGYRLYSERDLHVLKFIKRARILGFGLEQISELVSLWQNPKRTSREVKKIATTHIEALEQKIHEMTEMRDTIAHLVHACAGNHRPDCPILQGLGGTVNPEP